MNLRVKDLFNPYVMRTSAVYVAAMLVIMRLAERLGPMFGATEFFQQMLSIVLMLGFPVALFVAWRAWQTNEQTVPESGRGGEADSSVANLPDGEDGVATPLIGNMRITEVIVLVLTVVVAYLLYERLDGSSGSGDAENSVAVLPFTDLGSEGSHSYFGDGVAEEILNTLVRLPDLAVAARTSSFQFRENAPAVSEIGDQLGVSAILEGSIRRADDRVRVTATLIDTEDGFNLWSDTYEEPMDDIFEIQNRITRQIASAMQVQFDAKAHLATTSVPAAFDALLQGRQAFAEREGNMANRVLGIEQFQLATELDPEYAEAWAYYALALSKSYGGTLPPGMTDEQREYVALYAASRALDLEPGHPVATIAVVRIKALRPGELREALSLLGTALERHPNSSETLYAHSLALYQAGAVEQSLRQLRRVMLLDPLNLVVRRIHAKYLGFIGRFEDAQSATEEVVRMSGGGHLAPGFVGRDARHPGT
jgi:TolB-like protein